MGLRSEWRVDAPVGSDHVRYVEPARSVRIRLSGEALDLGSSAARWWDTDGGAVPVEDHDREALIARVRSWAEDHGRAVHDGSPPGPAPGAAVPDASLLAEIDRALDDVVPLARAGWDVAASIERQLRWCRATVAGEPAEPAPGPLTMGLIAVREFDMWGDRPELAARIVAIERAMTGADTEWG